MSLPVNEIAEPNCGERNKIEVRSLQKSPVFKLALNTSSDENDDNHEKDANNSTLLI